MSELFDLVAIGGGPAGYTAALRVAELGGRAAIVEEQAAGGNCVQHNCIPTMILLDTLEGAERAQSLGGVLSIHDGPPAFNRAVARKQQLVQAMTNGIRVQLRQQKVEFYDGRARIERPGRVAAALSDGSPLALDCRTILVATGARPDLPAVPGLDANAILTADTALRLTVVPESLLILGGAPNPAFVLEFARLFAGFGSRVTLIEEGDSILPGEEPLFAAALGETLRASGVEVMTDARLAGVVSNEAGCVARVVAAGGERQLVVAAICAPDRRRPYWADVGLEALRPEQANGALRVDEHGETSARGIFAAGDVTGGAMTSQAAATAGRGVSEHVMGRKSRRDDRFSPRAIFTDPEFAAVGVTEAAAKATGRAVRCGTANLLANARSLTMGGREGVVKVVADAESGQILGVHVIGPGAGELIGQAVLAMRLEATVEDLAAATHWHPTLSESLTEAARRAAGDA
ncbi:MAG TPA: NAD(P)/FAD-dependent oxidoreductase [Dehalococcoidia bacterium]|nr:NAD(P)/FAD-dependent oxidoreductase [Dehalococcoidia bacterium]